MAVHIDSKTDEWIHPVPSKPPVHLSPEGVGYLEALEGAITAPVGFVAAGCQTGVKRKRKDLALIASDRPASVAATFTTNRVKAAPLLVNQSHLQASGGIARAVVVNSGNANACTGEQGMNDALRMAQEAASALGVPVEQVLVASTGVIGVPMPMEKVVPGIWQAAGQLSREGWVDAMEGIMTTDTRPKAFAVRVDLGDGRWVSLGGIAKGSGMIHPNMATMLAFVTTDARLEPQPLQQALSRSVARTYNRISVDGDTSTNDMVLLLANGAAGGPSLVPGSEPYQRFCQALDAVNLALAKAIVADGEGASRVIEVAVSGAATEEEAEMAARAIANSSLVKTAFFGQDPNWGRILCAAGYSGAAFDPTQVNIRIAGVSVCEGGGAVPFPEGELKRLMGESVVRVEVELGDGPGAATLWTCDLSYEYVRINASYRT